MLLNDYLEQNDPSFSETARALGVAHATVVRRWCLPAGNSERLIPKRANMDKIVAFTGGKVMPNDFYSSHNDD